MKTVTIIITFLLTFKIYADCGGGWLRAWPSGSTLKQNSIIVLDGYDGSQDIINGLNKKHSAYLKCGDKTVKLHVREIYIGQFNLTQAVLTAEEKLIAGLEYQLYIDSLPLNRWNPKTIKNELVKWKVIAGTDNDKPTLTSKPKEIKKTLVNHGCGPARYVVFNCPVIDSSEFLIKTTVKNLKTGIEATYYIEPTNKQIKVGHDMCSGAFTFDDGKEYEVKFSFMDASGNLTSWKDKKIKFIKPTKETSYNEE